MSHRFLLHIAAELENLAGIRRFVEETALTLGVEPAVIPALQLAVDEAATNIILHGYQRRSGPLEIELEPAGSDLVVYLRDEAEPFDPTTAPSPDLTLPLEERAPGGMGIYLIRQSMDQISHRLTANGGNELTLIKRSVVGIEH